MQPRYVDCKIYKCSAQGGVYGPEESKEKLLYLSSRWSKYNLKPLTTIALVATVQGGSVRFVRHEVKINDIIDTGHVLQVTMKKKKLDFTIAHLKPT